MFLLFYEVKKRFFLVSYHVVKADDDMSSVSLLKRDKQAFFCCKTGNQFVEVKAILWFYP